MTLDEYKALGAEPANRRSRFGAKRSGGYDSKKEHRRAVELRMMERGGLISDLREQVAYELIPAQYGEPSETVGGMRTTVQLERPCRYIADFVYTDNATGREVVEDTKGYRTPEYRIKRKLMLWVHGIRIRET